MVTVVAERATPSADPTPVDTPVTDPTEVSSRMILLPKVKFAYPRSKLVAVVFVMLISLIVDELAVLAALNLTVTKVIFTWESSFALLVEILTTVPAFQRMLVGSRIVGRRGLMRCLACTATRSDHVPCRNQRPH